MQPTLTTKIGVALTALSLTAFGCNNREQEDQKAPVAASQALADSPAWLKSIMKPTPAVLLYDKERTLDFVRNKVIVKAQAELSKEELGAILKEGAHARPLDSMFFKNSYVVNRRDLKSEGELAALAKEGKCPLILNIYRSAEWFHVPTGTIDVWMKDRGEQAYAVVTEEAKRLGLKVLNDKPSNLICFKVTTDTKVDLIEAIQRLRAKEGVNYCRPDFIDVNRVPKKQK